MKSLLFLDVDGVLNVHPSTPNAEYVAVFEGMYRINLPVGLRDRITRLQDAYDFVWATTWRGKAHPFFAPILGLPAEPWPYVDFVCCKLPSIVEYAADRPFAWVDDEAVNQREHHPEVTTEPGITVAPSWHEGLTDEHVEQLLAFAAENQ